MTQRASSSDSNARWTLVMVAALAVVLTVRHVWLGEVVEAATPALLGLASLLVLRLRR